jgi:hypothetical protein
VCVICIFGSRALNFWIYISQVGGQAYSAGPPEGPPFSSLFFRISGLLFISQAFLDPPGFPSPHFSFEEDKEFASANYLTHGTIIPGS